MYILVLGKVCDLHFMRIVQRFCACKGVCYGLQATLGNLYFEKPTSPHNKRFNVNVCTGCVFVVGRLNNNLV